MPLRFSKTLPSISGLRDRFGVLLGADTRFFDCLVVAEIGCGRLIGMQHPE